MSRCGFHDCGSTLTELGSGTANSVAPAPATALRSTLPLLGRHFVGIAQVHHRANLVRLDDLRQGVGREPGRAVDHSRFMHREVLEPVLLVINPTPCAGDNRQKQDDDRELQFSRHSATPLEGKMAADFTSIAGDGQPGFRGANCTRVPRDHAARLGRFALSCADSACSRLARLDSAADPKAPFPSMIEPPSNRSPK